MARYFGRWFEIVDIAHHKPQQIVRAARHQIAFDHLRDGRDGGFEGGEGRLGVIPGSHTLGGYEKPKTTNEVVKLLPGGYTKHVEKNARWHSVSDMDIGDIIIFNIKLVHAATANVGEKYRLSINTRVVARSAVHVSSVQPA